MPSNFRHALDGARAGWGEALDGPPLSLFSNFSTGLAIGIFMEAKQIS